jgi:hypothetical protein
LWANPHIAIFFDAANPDSGKLVNWELGEDKRPPGYTGKGGGRMT